MVTYSAYERSLWFRGFMIWVGEMVPGMAMTRGDGRDGVP